MPALYVVDGFRLGQWVRVKRRSHERGQLTVEQVRELEGLDGWTWNPFDDAWAQASFTLGMDVFVVNPQGRRVGTISATPDEGFDKRVDVGPFDVGFFLADFGREQALEGAHRRHGQFSFGFF